MSESVIVASPCSIEDAAAYLFDFLTKNAHAALRSVEVESGVDVETPVILVVYKGKVAPTFPNVGFPVRTERYKRLVHGDQNK